MPEQEKTPSRRVVPRVAAVVGLLVIAGAGWSYMALRHGTQELERAQDALKLQVLASRLGAAAIHAEYGNFEESLSVASGVFDGIQSYGIARGSLPENYAGVLAARDEVVAQLARERPEVGERLVRLFFSLQLAVDTRLDPDLIIPATDSGAGLAPPARRAPAARATTTDSVHIPDSASARDSTSVPDSSRTSGELSGLSPAGRG